MSTFSTISFPNLFKNSINNLPETFDVTIKHGNLVGSISSYLIQYIQFLIDTKPEFKKYVNSIFDNCNGIDPIIQVGIAGGAYRSLLEGKRPKDIDLFFFLDPQILETACNPMDFGSYLFEFSLGKDPDNTQQISKQFFSLSGEDFSAHFNMVNQEVPINICAIKYIYESHSVLLDNLYSLLASFDNAAVTVGCSARFIKHNNKIMLISDSEIIESKLFQYAVHNKVLIPNELESNYPKMITIERFYKYIKQYGYSCTKENLKYFKQLLLYGINSHGVS